jgi:hypothetical protein
MKKNVYKHLFSKRFLPDYKNWTVHGEVKYHKPIIS